jgi:hypothetical protein
MSTCYNLLVFVHVSAGFFSLVLFWVPIWSKKGSPLHIRSGRWYLNIMYLVSISAFCLSILLMIDPIAAKFSTVDFSSQRAIEVSAEVRRSSLFLLAISILVLVNIRHGVLSLKAKRQHSLMRAPSHLLLNTCLLIAGISLIIAASGGSRILFIIFSGLCIATSVGNLRYCLKSEVANKEWLIAHLSSMIGAGIASYTAFFVFGGNRFMVQIFDGQTMMIPWVAPGVIGGSIISYLSYRYRKQFQARTNSAPVKQAARE